MNSKEKEQLYTVRWHLANFNSLSQKAALEILSQLLGEKPSDKLSQPSPSPLPALPPKEGGRGLVRVPFAVQIPKPSLTRGKYPSGYPVGAVVHFTAGHENQSGKDGIEFQVKEGHTYFFIDFDGVVYQNFGLNEWGYHAGESNWNGLGSGVSSKLVGIEVANPGQLNSKYKSWFGKTYQEEDCRKVPGLDNMEEGTYFKYNKKQEDALVKLILWLKENNPDIFNLDFVLGHDEVSGPKGLGWRRKNDPGGALSMTMPKFRAHLKSMYKL